MQHFMHQSTSIGIILLLTTVVALLFANTESLAHAYEETLHSYIIVGVYETPYYLKMSALHWINDGLMVIFFFLVGLEIKRELLVGELSNLRAAALPILAAVGGVVVPALIYTAFNYGGPGQDGWGVPMATDIAFAIGVIALLGSRVPFSLKVFLTAIAIVDDLMAVLVIALFYSGSIDLIALGIGFAVLAILFLANTLGFRGTWLYITLGIVVWIAFLFSGVHATIAGVLVAFTVPARNRIDEDAFLKESRELVDAFEKTEFAPTPMITDERQQSYVIALEKACENVLAPLQKLEHTLHLPVNFLIMPIFAFANAGVAISLSGLEGDNFMIVLGIIFGLVLGKPIGIFGASWLAIRLGITSLPRGVSMVQILGVGMLGGIGFTMSLFVASLGFGEGSELLEAAKLAILFASLVAGVGGFIFLSMVKSPDSGTQPAPASHGHGH
jgi:NhaA family Na+:H+ antiporter